MTSANPVTTGPGPGAPLPSLGPSLIWRNWVGNQTARVRHFAMPSDDEQVCELVKQAGQRDLSIRVVGSGHSFTPIVVTNDVLMSCERLMGIVDIDADKGTVTARAGTRISDLGEPLRELGWALANQGDIDLQTLAGALSTGTHGSGNAIPCLAAPIMSMTLATSDGGSLELSAAHTPDLLRAAQVSQGMLGIITRMTLRLVPAYDLHERVYRLDFDDCMEQIEDLCETNRSVRFFWCPTEHASSLFSLPDTTGLGTSSVADVCEMRVLKETTELAAAFAGRRGERSGPSYRIYPGALPMPNNNECEYAVPYEAGPDVMRAIRKLMLTRHTDCIFPVEYRTVAADEIWLSPYYKRKTVMISISGGAGEDYTSYLRDCEAIFAEVGGRPHWGKLYNLDRDQIAALYPLHADFVQERRRLDPQGRFLNDHLRERFG